MNTRKTFLLVATLLVAAGTAQGAVLTSDGALARANNYFRTEGQTAMHRAASAAAPQLVYTMTSKTNSDPAIYVFNYGSDKGFAIIPADDRLPEVLGFNDTGSFDANDIPANVQWWLDSYAQEIDYYYSLPASEQTDMNRVPRASGKEIQPLCTTQWNQSTPYNNLCPMDRGYRSVTGCVATALAQIMKYHNWPLEPTGSANGVKFDGTVYQWDQMLDKYVPNQYTAQEANAVATLMRQCGAAVNMSYSATESGAYINAVQTALTTYFDYNKGIRMLGRDYYSYSQWNEIVYAELEARRPVYYSGIASTGGHAFVCDGFRGNGYYHFNWGWGGVYDGYFLLNALNPGTGGIGSHAGGYNSSQTIVIGIEKEQGQGAQTQMSMWATSAFNWTSGYTFGFKGNRGMAYNPHDYTIEITYGLSITNDANVNDVTYVGCGAGSYPTYTGFTSITASSFPTDLPDGTYKIRPVLMPKNGDWQDLNVPFNGQTYVALTVKNGSYTFSNDVGKLEPHLIFNSLEHVAHINGDGGFAVRFFLSNVGDNDYVGKLDFNMREVDNPESLQTFTANVICPAGMTSTIDIVDEINFYDGSFKLDITDADGKTIVDDIPFEVEAPFIDYNWGKYKVSAISPSFGDCESSESVNTVIGIGSSVSEVTGVFQLLLKSYASDETLMSMQTGEATIKSNEPMTVVSQPVSFAQLGAGDYYWTMTNQEGENICGSWPLQLVDGPKTYGNIVYYVDNEKNKTAFVTTPLEGNYSGEIEIPDEIDGYKITSLRGGTFTFASEMTRVKLPKNIKTINGGEFYWAAALKEIEVTRGKPAAISEDVLPEERFKEITLTTPAWAANTYKRTPVWKNFFMPSWTIEVEEGINIVQGLVNDPATGKPYEPYYVSANDTEYIVIEYSGTQPVYLVYSIDGGEEHCLTFNQGAVRMPKLDGKSGKISINTTGVAGVTHITSDTAAPVYDIFGLKVSDSMTERDLAQLPAGIYIYKGRKIVVRR